MLGSEILAAILQDNIFVSLKTYSEYKPTVIVLVGVKYFLYL